MDLFNNTVNNNNKHQPLAERMRCHQLQDFFGQEHLSQKNSLIRLLIENKSNASLILWGPPGCGKTTLANIIATETKHKFHKISAVNSSIKDLKAIIEQAAYNLRLGFRTILFIDEIHRYNKIQQDALLHSVEDGTVILIGATTENPSFEVNKALLSRSRVVLLNKLNSEALDNILEKALDTDTLLKDKNIEFADDSRQILLEQANGDARKLLNLLELLVSSDEQIITITNEKIKNALLHDALAYDKKGDMHYDVISAFIKSIRGSDPDAAVYYLAIMLQSGEDPKFIARRMIISASEDIGNASPNALVLATSTFQAIDVIGMPEARIILSQCATYLASQPKSNASYMAINKAYNTIQDSSKKCEVPLHLRNAPTGLMKKLNYGKEYKYSHDYPENFVEQQFLPDEIKNQQFYLPSENGQEKGLKDRLKRLWKTLKRY